MENLEALRSDIEARLPAGLEILRNMVGINSFTANRAGVDQLGRFTAEVFSLLEFKPEFVPSTNRAWADHLVMTRHGRSGRSVAMISHLDTVFPPEEELRHNFCWAVEGDRIYGPGTHDIKGGTLMMWLVLSALRAQAPQVFEAITWKLLWNSSEECFSPDFEQVCRSRFERGTLAALVFEAEGREQGKSLLVVARKGRATWRATARGRGAHAGGNHPAGANAVAQLAATVGKITGLTDYSRDLTFNVATISGGTVLNRVPHEAVAEGEFRAFGGDVFQSAKSALLALSGNGEVASQDGFPCSVLVEVLSQSRPWPRNAGSDGLLAIWQQAGDSLGMPIGPQERGGLSDGNLVWDAVPTIDGLGPWGENGHCSERSSDGSKTPEFVEISSIVPKAVLNCAAIHHLAAGTRQASE